MKQADPEAGTESPQRKRGRYKQTPPAQRLDTASPLLLQGKSRLQFRLVPKHIHALSSQRTGEPDNAAVAVKAHSYNLSLVAKNAVPRVGRVDNIAERIGLRGRPRRGARSPGVR